MFESLGVFGLLGSGFVSKAGTGLSVLTKYLAAGGMVWAGSKIIPPLVSPDRERLKKAFRAADICIKSKRISPVDGKSYEAFTYPQIKRIRKKDGQLAITFRLPIGFNPADLERKEYVFRQTFGPHAYLVRSDDRFYRLIVTPPLPVMVPYVFEVVQKAFTKTGGLPVYVGTTRSGKPICYDMREKPHLGIVGVTGYGKSSFLRTILCSWMQHFRPDQLRLYLGDLKKTEFQQFRDVHHVERVAVRKKEVTAMLREVANILDARSTMFGKIGATNLQQYQKKTGEQLPFIVVCIDEVALLQKDKLAHEYLEEIGAVGRALGVFLLLSQQRVDSEIMNGRLKNNLTVRLAFRMSDALNSRMFIENDAAAQLGVPGRAIVKEPDRISEVQTPWLSEEEAERIIERFKTEKDVGCSDIIEHQEEIIFGELI